MAKKSLETPEIFLFIFHFLKKTLAELRKFANKRKTTI